MTELVHGGRRKISISGEEGLCALLLGGQLWEEAAGRGGSGGRNELAGVRTTRTIPEYRVVV